MICQTFDIIYGSLVYLEINLGLRALVLNGLFLSGIENVHFELPTHDEASDNRGTGLENALLSSSDNWIDEKAINQSLVRLRQEGNREGGAIA